MLGRSLDELPPQTRRVLGLIESLVESEARQRSLARSDVRFTRRELRARCGMSDTAIRVHLERLVGMEYVRAAAGRNGLRFEYELLFDGELSRSVPQMIGLIDADTLVTTAATSQGPACNLAPGLQAARTGLAPALPSVGSAANAGMAVSSNEAGADVANTEPHQQSAAFESRSISRAPASSNSSSLAAVSASVASGG